MGIVAAKLMELKLEKDRWQGIARDWYARIGRISWLRQVAPPFGTS